jgi:phosphoribosylpyrophosphate synthetase
MKEPEEYLIFCGRGNRPLGIEVLKLLGEYLGKNLEFKFIDFGVWRDGCPNDKIINFEEVKGKKIILFDSLTTKEAMFDFAQIVMAFRKQYGAASLLAVNPFLLVRRCDHEEKMQEISYLKHYVELLAFAGVTDMIVCAPHSDEIANNCKKVGINFEPAYMDFSRALKTIVPKGEKVIFYSPDEGSIPRAIAHARKMPGAKVMFNLKIRKENNKTEILKAEKELIAALIAKYSEEFNFNLLSYIDEKEIKDANIIMIDDELSSADTASSTARDIKAKQAKAIFFAFTHPVCVNGWKQNIFFNNPFTKILAGNTIIRGENNRTGGKIIDISTAEVIAAAMYGLMVR